LITKLIIALSCALKNNALLGVIAKSKRKQTQVLVRIGGHNTSEQLFNVTPAVQVCKSLCL